MCKRCSTAPCEPFLSLPPGTALALPPITEDWCPQHWHMVMQEVFQPCCVSTLLVSNRTNSASLFCCVLWCAQKLTGPLGQSKLGSATLNFSVGQQFESGRIFVQASPVSASYGSVTSFMQLYTSKKCLVSMGKNGDTETNHWNLVHWWTSLDLYLDVWGSQRTGEVVCFVQLRPPAPEPVSNDAVDFLTSFSAKEVVTTAPEATNSENEGLTFAASVVTMP